MDPLRALPEEVCESIFMHFNGTDVLNASLVSKHWYQITAKSKECMSKIIGCHLSYRKMPDIQHLLNSERQYQHMLILHDLNVIKHNTKMMRNLRAIVSKFAGSLITLNTWIDIPRTYELPKLKELKINCSANYEHKFCIEKLGLTSKAKRLENLFILCTDLCQKSVETVQQNIKDIKGLKALIIEDYFILDELSSENLENLKLEKFQLHESSDVEWVPAYYEFFNTQRPYLKFIDCNMSFQQIVFFMEHFPKLETLIARNDISGEEEMYELMYMDTLTYPANESITTFGYHGFVLDGETNNLVSIFSKIQNLQMLQLQIIDPMLTDTIADLKSLEIVEFCKIYSYSSDYIRRIYQNIQRSNCIFIKKDSFRDY